MIKTLVAVALMIGFLALLVMSASIALAKEHEALLTLYALTGCGLSASSTVVPASMCEGLSLIAMDSHEAIVDYECSPLKETKK